MPESSHPTTEVLERYVIGALELLEQAEVEAHAASCARCAAALQREAALELRLMEVAAVAPPPGQRALPARVTGALVGLSMAVAAVLAAVMYVPPPPAAGAPRVVRCDDPGSAADCAARAGYEGVISLGPHDEIVVPRYEQVPGQPQPRSTP